MGELASRVLFKLAGDAQTSGKALFVSSEGHTYTETAPVELGWPPVFELVDEPSADAGGVWQVRLTRTQWCRWRIRRPGIVGEVRFYAQARVIDVG